jgi:hypothetical protein
MWQALIVSAALVGQNCSECATLPPAPRGDVSVRVNSPEIIPTPAPRVESPVEAGTVFVPVHGRCRVVVDEATGRAFVLKHEKRRSRVVAVYDGFGVGRGSPVVRVNAGAAGGYFAHVKTRRRGSGGCRVRVKCR